MRWVAALLVLGSTPAFSQEDGADFFEKRIRPVLAERCYECHSIQANQAKKLKGNLFLDSREGSLRGGDSGPAVVPRSLDQSLLIQAIRHVDPDLKMPPKQKLPAGVIADFEKWIQMGAPDPRTAAAPKRRAINFEEARQYWAFKPIALPALPAVRDTAWERTPVDRFILAKLEAKGLRPASDADKRTLIRRASFDLIGLPPTPEEIDAFLADRSPDAFARVIDRLLASPHYGERWGRHWLDVVRYADTAGDNSDFPIPQIHLYRNYVLKSINEDKPYDQFIREQLAGDLLPHASEPERLEKIIATGYIANAKRFGSTIDDYPWHLTIEDTLDNLGRAFLGLTVNCSRCHDHKFDPITNEDYYALYGIFESTKYPWPGIELEQSQRDFIPLVPPAQADSVLKERAARKAALDASIKEMEAHKKAVEKAIAQGDDKDDETVRLRQYLDDVTKTVKASTTERDTWRKQPLPFPTAYAVAEAPKTGNAKVQIKGDPAKPGVEIPRRFLEVLGGRSLASDIKGSGRLQLAEWIADPSNPLTARVMANRLWHYHFGKGIVPTPNDFGRQGRPPSHPELLDWLASRFIDSGWSLKAMHRTILLSRAWQLSSHDDGSGAVLDPDNDLLQHQRRRRLDAESIRDSLLAVSGGLDRSIGGPHPFPAMTAWGFTQHKPFIAVYENNLRSVYLMQQRIRRHPYFGVFDGADPSTGTATRVTSTTTLQALYFLNDPFVHEQATKLAARVRKERANDASRIDRAYQLTLGRPVEDVEIKAGLDYLAGLRAYGDEAQAWDSYVRILLRLSEFVYVR